MSREWYRGGEDDDDDRSPRRRTGDGTQTVLDRLSESWETRVAPDDKHGGLHLAACHLDADRLLK